MTIFYKWKKITFAETLACAIHSAFRTETQSTRSPLSIPQNAILSVTTSCIKHSFPQLEARKTDKAIAKRLLKRKSICSDDQNSIENNPCYEELIEQTREQPVFRINHASRYRNSIEFSFPLENENFLMNDTNGKIRFPSFESTMNSTLKGLSTKNDLDATQKLDPSFYNQFSFDLESDAKQMLASSRGINENEKKLFWNLIHNKIKSVSSSEKCASVMKYKIKKSRRKMSYKIRYKVRQDLAIKRLRNKGKFIKSKKIDIRTAANMIMIG